MALQSNMSIWLKYNILTTLHFRWSQCLNPQVKKKEGGGNILSLTNWIKLICAKNFNTLSSGQCDETLDCHATVNRHKQWRMLQCPKLIQGTLPQRQHAARQCMVEPWKYILALLNGHWCFWGNKVKGLQETLLTAESEISESTSKFQQVRIMCTSLICTNILTVVTLFTQKFRADFGRHN